MFHPRTTGTATPVTKRRSAFTLVELLVVIAIISLLISMLLPTLNRAREQAIQVKCLSNARQLHQAVMMFANDHNNRAPGSGGNTGWGVGAFVQVSGAHVYPPPRLYRREHMFLKLGYLESTEIFECPGHLNSQEFATELFAHPAAKGMDSIFHYTYNQWVVGNDLINQTDAGSVGNPNYLTAAWKQGGEKTLRPPLSAARRATETVLLADMAFWYDRMDRSSLNLPDTNADDRSLMVYSNIGGVSHRDQTVATVAYIDGHAVPVEADIRGNDIRIPTAIDGFRIP